MTFSIQRINTRPGEPILYEPGFRNVIETHLSILRRPPAATVRRIAADKLYQFEGDFYGLLKEQGVLPEMHWIYLRVNGFESPNQFGRELRRDPNREYHFDLIAPTSDAIGELFTLYSTVRN